MVIEAYFNRALVKTRQLIETSYCYIFNSHPFSSTFIHSFFLVLLILHMLELINHSYKFEE